MTKRESVRVLEECIELQNKKGADYQSAVSPVRQADYYPSGVRTIHEIMHAKMLRLQSVMAKREAGLDVEFESLEDSAKDLINYASFFVAYLRGGVDGQDPSRDEFNRTRSTSSSASTEKQEPQLLTESPSIAMTLPADPRVVTSGQLTVKDITGQSFNFPAFTDQFIVTGADVSIPYDPTPSEVVR